MITSATQLLSKFKSHIVVEWEDNCTVIYFDLNG
jgi:hypothetical protein